MAAVALGVAGLAASIGGSVMGAQAQAAGSRAAYEQQRINQQWSEFEKQMSLTQQRGAMGLAEFDRLFGNATLERESLEQQVYGQRAYREQSQYNLSQIARASRQTEARQSASLASRGMARGGSSDAIKNQLEVDSINDLARIQINDENALAAFGNQRNQMLKQRNMRPSTQPPTYIPATPVQSPNTNGMMMGAVLGGLASGLGGLGGAISAAQSPSAAGAAPGGQMGPFQPSHVSNPFPASSMS